MLAPRPSSQWRTWLAGYALIAPPLALLALLIFFPAGQAIVRTVMLDQDAGITSGLTLDRYLNFFNDPIARSNLSFTITVTLITVFFQFAVCFPLALYLRFSTSRIAGAVQVLALFRSLSQASSSPLPLSVISARAARSTLFCGSS